MTPLYANEKTAAKLLDLKPSEFLTLVDQGALPPPIKVGKYNRWDVEQIKAVISGKAALPKEVFTI
jgi:predicted DNA-binding transcriptional regulator AlpA